jgi:hypothetical protein
LRANGRDGGEDPAFFGATNDEIATHARDVPRMGRADRKNDDSH